MMLDFFILVGLAEWRCFFSNMAKSPSSSSCFLFPLLPLVCLVELEDAAGLPGLPKKDLMSWK